MKRWFVRILVLGLVMVIGIVSLYFYSNNTVETTASKLMFDNVNDVPQNKVGLLLGSGKFLANGNLNPYYEYRINAAVELYQAGKIQFIVASGDNHTVSYDEPTLMLEDLIARGVPANKVFLDFAGFRTLDSVVRCKEIFGQNKFTLISQKWHNERAIYIAKNKGLDVVGYNAKDVNATAGQYTNNREKLARVKMMLDLWFGKEPKFLGKKIQVQ